MSAKPSLIPASGTLPQDQTWGGRIRVSGDVVVPEGITLTLAAGAAVAFSRACEYRYQGGGSRLDAHKCSLVVLGRLVVEGEVPVALGGEEAWGGLHFMGRGQGLLRGLRLAGGAAHGVALWDEASAELEDVQIRRCWTGLGAYGASRVAMRECRVEDARESGVILEGAGARLEGVECRGFELAGFCLRGAAAVEMRGCRALGGRAGVLAQGGRSLIKDCEFHGQSAAGLDFQRGEHRLEGAALSGPGGGLYVGASRVAAFGLRAACAENAAAVSGEGELEWTGGGWTGGRIGCLVSGGRARLEDVAGEGSAQGIRLVSGALSASGLSLKGHVGAALVALEEGSARLERSRLSDCAAGVVSAGAAVALADCAFSAIGGVAVELQGGGHALERVTVEEARVGLSVSLGETRARALELRCSERAAVVRGGAVLRWAGGGWKGGEVGLQVASGAAELESVDGEKCLQGIRLEAGSLFARRLTLRAMKDLGLTLEGDSRARLLESVFEDCPVGLLARGGTSRLEECRFRRCASMGCGFEQGVHSLKNCEFDPSRRGAIVGPEASLNGEGPARDRSPSLLWRFVLRTRRWPLLRSAYKAIYAAALVRVRSWARREPRIAAALVHRGWVTGDWEPGVSDLDLVLIAQPLDFDWVEGFWRLFSAWRRRFPFLGEVCLASPADARCYLRWGGQRARELRAQGRILSGTLPETLGELPGSLERLTECAHAYTRLMQWSAPNAGVPPGFAAAQRLKAVADVRRYASAASGPVPGRKEFLEKNPDASPAAAPRAFHEAAVRYWSAQASAAGGASSYRWISPRPAPGPADDAGAPAPLKACFGGGLRGLFRDDLYRSYIVVEDGVFESAFEKWLAWRRDRPWRGTLPVVLSETLWRLWRRLPYLECPVRFLEFQANARAGAWFPGYRQSAWGPIEPPGAPPDEAVRAAALECAANLRMNWRLLGAPAAAFSADYILHYLFSRALGLRLLLDKRVGASFFDLDALVGLYRDVFPEEGAALDRLGPPAAADSPRQAFAWSFGFLEERIGGLGGVE